MKTTLARLAATVLLVAGCAHRPSTGDYIADLQEQIDIQRRRLDLVEGRPWTQAREDSMLQALDARLDSLGFTWETEDERDAARNALIEESDWYPCGQSDLPVSEWSR